MFGRFAASTAATICSASAAFRPSGFSHITILPALRGGDGDLGMRVVRARDVDEVDVLAGDQVAPVRLEGLVAPICREGLGARRVARANRLEDRLGVQLEELVDLGEGVGVGAAHEAGAHEADVEFLLRAHAQPPKRRFTDASRARRAP